MIKSTITITAFSALNLVITFGTQLILAKEFGTSLEMDSYLIASTVPTILVGLFQNTMNITFIPAFVEYAKTGKGSEAWNAVSNAMNILGVVAIAVFVVGFALSPQIADIIAPQSPKETLTLASQLMRLLWPIAFFGSVGAMISSIYYAQRRYWIPSLGLSLNVLAILLSVVFLHQRIGIFSAAVGVTLGSIVQLLFLIPGILKGYVFRIFKPGDEDFRGILRVIMPLIVGSLFYKATTLYDRFFLSALPQGSISYIGYAYKILTILTLLVSKGLSLSLLPKMSENVVAKNATGLENNLYSGIYAALFVAVPVWIFLTVYRVPIIGEVFERKSFTSNDTLNVSDCLLFYSGAFFAMILSSHLTNLLYAKKSTMVVVKIGVFGALLNILLNYLLSQYIGFLGIALAFSIIATVNTGLQFLAIGRVTELVKLPSCVLEICKYLVLAGFMVVFLRGLNEFYEPKNLVDLIIPLLGGIAAYLSGAALLRLRVLTIMKSRLLNQ